jgi:hypothetical protein
MKEIQGREAKICLHRRTEHRGEKWRSERKKTTKLNQERNGKRGPKEVKVQKGSGIHQSRRM